MPSKTPKQKRFMAACAHGAGYKSCPPKSVAKEYNMADKKKSDKKKSEKPKARTETSARPLLGEGIMGKSVDKLKRKYAGYADGGLVTKQGPVADWHTAGRKVRQDYSKKGKRSTR